MRSINICLALPFFIGSVAYSRPTLLTVEHNEPAIAFNSFELREQTTRAFLPGCTWPDVLQGTGWFPATFYSRTQATAIDSNTVSFKIVKRSQLAAYCGAVTDNVANNISFTIPHKDTGLDIYGSIPFTLGTSNPSQANVECRYVQAENESHGQYFCDNASLSADGELVINLKLIME